jgi:heme A synthase
VTLNRFATFAWVVLAYTVLVILWGAFVRATGSGAGCGSHWPTCNGEVVPRLTDGATVIEFSHRVMSGPALVAVLGLAVWAFRAYPKGNPIRWAAVFSAVVIVIEALFGAGLVVFGLTAKNDSLARAIVVAIHLVNTFLLLGGLTLTAWWASGGRPLQWRGQGGLGWAFAGGLLAVLAIGATGAITALGDTLFPANSLAEGLQQNLSPTAQLLVQLRVVHPLLAVLVGAGAVAVGSAASVLRRGLQTRRLALVLAGIYVIQMIVGIVNVSLLVPIPLQIIHLLLADLLWIVLVLTAAVALAEPAPVGQSIAPVAARPEHGTQRPA